MMLSPKSKDIVAGSAMLIFMIVLLIIILGSTIGCAPRIPVKPQFAAHVGIDNDLFIAKSQQSKAVAQIRLIEKSVTTPIVKKQIDDLQQTITDLGAQIDTTTGKIHWYENQYQSLYAENEAAHKSLDIAIAYGQSEHKARVAASKRADVVIYIFAIAMAIAAFRATYRAAVTPVSGFAGLVVPGAAFVIGFASAYGFAYYTLNFLSRFLPDFSWLQHKV